jgi:hypothetical protein
MQKPGFDLAALRRTLQSAGTLNAFDEAVHILDVTHVMEILREAKLPEEEVRRAAAAVLVESSMKENP